MAMRRIVAAFFVLALGASAHAETRTIELTDQQIDTIIAGGAQCEAKVPYACAEYLVYIRNMLNGARQPKPPPPPAPEPPK